MEVAQQLPERPRRSCATSTSRSTTGAQVPLSAVTHFAEPPRPARRQPPGALARHHALLQPRARRLALAGHRRHRKRARQDRHALHHPRRLPGHRAGLPGSRSPPSPSSSCSRSFTVYIVLGILYESFIHPHHHPLHAALRRRRRLCSRSSSSRSTSPSSP